MKTQRYVTTDFQQAMRLLEIANEESTEQNARERAKKNLDFVQFQRSGMREFVQLIDRSPAAAQALVALATYMNIANVISVPIKSLCEMCGTSRSTMSRAIQLLSNEGWLNITKIGVARAYQINSNIFWSAARDLKQFSDIFTASIKSTGDGKCPPAFEHAFRAKPVAVVVPSKLAAKAKKDTRHE